MTCSQEEWLCHSSQPFVPRLGISGPTRIGFRLPRVQRSIQHHFPAYTKKLSAPNESGPTKADVPSLAVLVGAWRPSARGANPDDDGRRRHQTDRRCSNIPFFTERCFFSIAFQGFPGFHTVIDSANGPAMIGLWNRRSPNKAGTATRTSQIVDRTTRSRRRRNTLCRTNRRHNADIQP